MNIVSITQEIVVASNPILIKYNVYPFKPKLDYVDIFPVDENEQQRLQEELETLGEPVYKTSTGNTYKLYNPIETAEGPLHLLRVRSFDPTRLPFRGHPDYELDDFEKAKELLLTMKNVSLIDRIDYQMIEIWDKDFNVLVYFPNIPLSKDIK